MSDLMKLIQDADSAAIEFEHARAHVENLKNQLDAAKTAQDEARTSLDAIVNRADDLGIPKAKVKKLIEERAHALMTSGLISADGESKKSSVKSAPKTQKTPKKLKAVPDPTDMDDLANRPANERLIMEMN